MSRPDWLPADVGFDGERVLVVVRAGEPAPGWTAGGLVVPFDDDVDALHADIARHGPFDLVVDAVGAQRAVRRVVCLAGHVRPGGRLVVRRPARGTAARERLDGVLTEAVALRRTGDLEAPHRYDRRTGRDRDLAVLGAGVRAVATTPQAHDLRLDPDRPALLATLTDAEVTPARLTPADTVIAVEPARTYPAAGSLTSSSAADQPLGLVEAPALTLRRYADVVCAQRSVVTRGGVVLPDTFRHAERRRLRTPELVAWGAHAVIAPAAVEPEPLPGVWYHADNVMRGHFGHALTEQLSRLWGWSRALGEHPDLGLLVFERDGLGLAEWELELLEAVGVGRDRVRVQVGPVRVGRLVSATPAYDIDGYVHPVMGSLYERVGALADRSTLSSPERVFLTRRDLRRGCRDNSEVEALFAAHGFTVVAPEEHPLADQVALVRDAEVVAGYGGSAMFHLAFARRAQRVVVVSHDQYHVANEKQISALRGHHLTIVRARADVPRGDHFSEAAMHSSFALDLDDEHGPGGRLRAVLAELG